MLLLFISALLLYDFMLSDWLGISVNRNNDMVIIIIPRPLIIMTIISVGHADSTQFGSSNAIHCCFIKFRKVSTTTYIAAFSLWPNSISLPDFYACTLCCCSCYSHGPLLFRHKVSTWTVNLLENASTEIYCVAYMWTMFVYTHSQIESVWADVLMDGRV